MAEVHDVNAPKITPEKEPIKKLEKEGMIEGRSVTPGPGPDMFLPEEVTDEMPLQGVAEPEPGPAELLQGEEAAKLLRGRVTPLVDEHEERAAVGPEGEVAEKKEVAQPKKPDLQKAAKLLGTSREEVTLAISTKARRMFGLEAKPSNVPARGRADAVVAKPKEQEQPKPKPVQAQKLALLDFKQASYSKYLDSFNAALETINTIKDPAQQVWALRRQVEKTVTAKDIHEGLDKLPAKKGVKDPVKSLEMSQVLTQQLRKELMGAGIESLKINPQEKEKQFKKLDLEQKYLTEKVSVLDMGNESPIILQNLLDFCLPNAIDPVEFIDMHIIPFEEAQGSKQITSLREKAFFSGIEKETDAARVATALLTLCQRQEQNPIEFINSHEQQFNTALGSDLTKALKEEASLKKKALELQKAKELKDAQALKEQGFFDKLKQKKTCSLEELLAFCETKENAIVFLQNNRLNFGRSIGMPNYTRLGNDVQKLGKK